MEDMICQVSLAYNGDLVITGYINGQKHTWVISQEEMIRILRSRNDEHI